MAKKKKQKVKKRNPADATRRNVSAANKKIALLTARVTVLEEQLEQVVGALSQATGIIWGSRLPDLQEVAKAQNIIWGE